MEKELELLLATARILAPLHPTLQPLIDAIDPPATIEQPIEEEKVEEKPAEETGQQG